MIDANEMKQEILDQVAMYIKGFCDAYTNDRDVMNSSNFLMCIMPMLTIVSSDAAGHLEDPEMLINTAKELQKFDTAIKNNQER